MCIAGGMAKVYDLGPYFRNGSADATHSIPFNALELYWGYSCFPEVRKFAQELLECIISILGKYDIVPPSKSMDLTFKSLMKQTTGLCLPEIRTYEETKALYDLLKERWLPTTSGMFFLEGLPAGISPHISVSPRDADVLLRGHAVLDGVAIMEYFEGETNHEKVAKSLSVQRSTLQSSQNDIRRNWDYLNHALLIGMPPFSSIFLSVDRLVNLLFGNRQLNEYSVIV